LIDHYDWAGGREAMLRFGPTDGPVLVVAMPLLEEWNRTRAFVVTLLRALSDRGIGSVLPDLPGPGESLAALPTLRELRQAFAAASTGCAGVLAVRSGALVAMHGGGHWHLSPVAGAELVRDLDRVRLTAKGTLVAGWDLAPGFTESLHGAEPPAGARVVRLASDPRPADRKVNGAPLWRRSEPGNDVPLTRVLADDIAVWRNTCAA
jgi:hypothetical protein